MNSSDIDHSLVDPPSSALTKNNISYSYFTFRCVVMSLKRCTAMPRVC